MKCQDSGSCGAYTAGRGEEKGKSTHRMERGGRVGAEGAQVHCLEVGDVGGVHPPR